MYVYMYACMYACMGGYMYFCMYFCIYVCIIIIIKTILKEKVCNLFQKLCGELCILARVVCFNTVTLHQIHNPSNNFWNEFQIIFFNLIIINYFWWNFWIDMRATYICMFIWTCVCKHKCINGWFLFNVEFLFYEEFLFLLRVFFFW